MKNLRQDCIQWYHNEFKTLDLWKDMVDTTEDSPWHREVNVGIHTDMVVSQYLARTRNMEWDRSKVIGFLTVVFHDVGKPYSEITKFKEGRGNYRAYHGHEIISARLFENFICDNTVIADRFNLDKFDIYSIAWLIEHHVPWQTTNPITRTHYAKTVYQIFREQSVVFSKILLSDTYGRISDDFDTKCESANEWVSTFNDLIEEVKDDFDIDDDNKTVYIPIACSGTGKSTFENTLDIVTFSLDALRLEWYPGASYSDSFEGARNDPQFSLKANAVYMKQIKNGLDLYIDNTNLSKRRRAFYVNEARKHGYNVVAVYFPISIAELTRRQNARTDKVIPRSVFGNMYKNLQLPSFGEFDDIIIVR